MTSVMGEDGRWEVVVKKMAKTEIFVSVFMMGCALLVKLTRGSKMQESPENNLRTEDSICLFVFNVLLRDCAYLTCGGSDGSQSKLILQEGA
jgi:hypothetical protein